MAHLSFQSLFGAFLSWSLSGAVSLTGLIARLQQLRGLNVRKAVYTELSSRGLSAPFSSPFSYGPPLPSRSRLCRSFVILSAVRLFSRSRVTDSTPGICGLPALTFLSCSAYRFFGALSLQTLRQGPPRPLRELPGVRWASTTSHCHLRHQTSGSATHTHVHTHMRTAEIFKTFPTEKHFEVRTDTEHLDKPAPKTRSYFSFSLSLEKNKSCPHRCHQSERTNGALTCQRRWGVCRRKEKRGEMKGGKAWGRWEKRVWQGLGLLAYLWGQIFCSTSIYLSAVASA